MDRDRQYDRPYGDDARRDPRERYGNEEDQYSREARRSYREQDLPRRMHDDRPYNQPGYEPEGGLPGGRENVDLDRERGRAGGRGPSERGGQGRYDDRSRGGPGGDRYGFDFERPAGDRGQAGQWNPRQTSGAGGGYSSGRPASPYDQGEVGSWYGGDTGMGDSGSSLDRPRAQDQDPRRSGQQQESQSRQPGQYGRPRQYGQQRDPLDGPFTGRGPRGYQRSDERISEDVCELLTRHGQIDASSLEVDVHQATVTLRGTADSGRIRRLIEEVVEDISGVRDVENHLRVNQRTGYGYTADTMQPGDMGAPQTRGVPAYGTGVAETSGVSRRTGPGEPGASAGAGPSQHGNRWQIRETMDVVGSDGASVGTVNMVRGTDFQVDRPMSRDLYVPFSAVRTVDGERVLLSCRASEVDQQNWPTASPTSGVLGSGS